MPSLPEIPKAELYVIDDRSAEGEGFLTLKRVGMQLARADGTRSATFPYDAVERRALDAAVVAAHYVEAGKMWVYLRSAIRPPLALRSIEPKTSAVLWELPAGLIEPGEEARAGGARELDEELGFTLEPSALEPLGPWAFPAPGFIAEMQWFFHARVDPAKRHEPKGDGSPLEDAARIIAVTLDDALAACRRGEIRDEKTELGLRRLADAFA